MEFTDKTLCVVSVETEIRTTYHVLCWCGTGMTGFVNVLDAYEGWTEHCQKKHGGNTTSQSSN